jgi:hypothetical protein
MTSKEATDSMARITEAKDLRREVFDVVTTMPVIDVHTHLFAPEFGDLTLFGIDELLTYHYLVAELFRSNATSTDDFWQMSKAEQADLIWQALFVENTPISEATRGIVTVLTAFGLDPAAADLREAREFFASRSISSHINQVLEMARATDVVMTNDPFDGREAYVWESGVTCDTRFHAALRLDRLLNDWSNTSAKLTHLGYRVDSRSVSNKSLGDVRRYIDRWISLMRPLYMAVSLPDNFTFPDSDTRDRIIREVVLPVARDYDLPLAMMIGVRRGVNPGLKWAGDGLGKADVKAVERMCLENPEVRFMATFLSRENQHELCVAARKFSNLMPFGCWWFLNNPSIIAEITRERLELLGTSFIPQHSDARILEQLIYKWEHSRQVIAGVLYELYSELLVSGRAVTRAEIVRDVTRMLSGNFREWVNLPATTTIPAGAKEFAEPDMVTTK